MARDEKDINYKRHPPSDGNLLEVIQNEAPFDMFIHLGDAEGSEDMITSWCKEQNPDCEVYMVLGNNDFFSHLTVRRRFRLEIPHISNPRSFL